VSRFIRMRKQRKEHKRHVARKPDEVVRFKERFIAELAKGCAPGVAAHNVKIARATAYKWKKEDQEFDAAWVDAVETSLDELETRVYKSAMDGNSSDAQFILKHRRRAVYGNAEDRPRQTNFILNVTLKEQLARLERLGLPLPVIESDIEDDDAADSTTAHHP
jgi:hypothetical protein